MEWAAVVCVVIASAIALLCVKLVVSLREMAARLRAIQKQNETILVALDFLSHPDELTHE